MWEERSTKHQSEWYFTPGGHVRRPGDEVGAGKEETPGETPSEWSSGDSSAHEPCGTEWEKESETVGM